MKSSIFDEIYEDPPKKNQKIASDSLWESKEIFEENLETSYISSKIIYSGILVYQDNEDQVIDLKIDLYEDRLVAYLDEKKTSLFGIIGLKDNVKLEYTDIENSDEDEIQFLFFQKKSRIAILFCELPKDFEMWIKKLRQICILANFSQYYTFEKVIGKGTFAKVVMCSRNEDKKQFAVKVFDKSNLAKAKDNKQQISAIQNEINIMRQLNHPNIIKMHEVYEGGKHIYIVLELLTGGELFKKIYDEENFSEQIVISLMRNLLQALQYLHALNIMHRDIKPENLIIRDKVGSLGDIVLADFGLSEFIGKKKQLFKRCGTPGYVAPEILANNQYGIEVDVFSAGVIMYILLTGCSPFYGESYMEILNKNKAGIIDFDFKTMGCKLSTNSINLLKAMLKINPKERITINEALQHPWFKEKGESLLTKVHHQTMEQLLQQQKQLIKTTKPQNMNESQNLITNSPLINGSVNSLSNSAKNSPNSSNSPSALISPFVEKKSKFAGMKQK